MVNAAVGGSSQLSCFLQEAQTHGLALLKSKFCFSKFFFFLSSSFLCFRRGLNFPMAQHSSPATFCALPNLKFLLLKESPPTNAEASAWEKSQSKIQLACDSFFPNKNSLLENVNFLLKLFSFLQTGEAVMSKHWEITSTTAQFLCLNLQLPPCP